MIFKQAFNLKKNGEPDYTCFCRHPELIENYDKAIADTTQTWECHHRLETHNSDGERRSVDLSTKELIALDMYYDRPPEELIFLTKSEHRRLHGLGVGFKNTPHSHKGMHWFNNGKKQVRAYTCPEGFTRGVLEVSKLKASKASKGRKLSKEFRDKIKSTARARSKAYYKCIETGEVKLAYEWRDLGFRDCGLSASTRFGAACKGYHFKKIDESRN